MKLICTLLFLMLGMGAWAEAPGSAQAQMAPPPSGGGSPGHSYLMINPKSRAQDFKQAYDVLRKERTSQRVYFEIADGSTISNIIDVLIMDNGTIMYFRYNTAQGVKAQIVPVEDVVGVKYVSS